MVQEHVAGACMRRLETAIFHTKKDLDLQLPTHGRNDRRRSHDVGHAQSRQHQRDSSISAGGGYEWPKPRVLFLQDLLREPSLFLAHLFWCFALLDAQVTTQEHHWKYLKNITVRVPNS